MNKFEIILEIKSFLLINKNIFYDTGEKIRIKTNKGFIFMDYNNFYLKYRKDYEVFFIAVNYNIRK